MAKRNEGLPTAPRRRSKKNEMHKVVMFVPYRKESDSGFRMYIKARAQADHRLGTLATRWIPTGAWTGDHGNGSRVVVFYDEKDAKAFKNFYWDVTGIERIEVISEGIF